MKLTLSKSQFYESLTMHSKIKVNTDKELSRKMEKHQRRLKEWCEKILDRIFDPELVDKMPQKLRIVASYIAEVSDSLQLDTPVLIGGFIILRFVHYNRNFNFSDFSILLLQHQRFIM